MEYEEQMKMLRTALAGVSKKSGSKSAKAAANERSDSSMLVCQVVRELVNEGLEMYENGDMTFEEMVKDITKGLSAIDPKSLKDDLGEEDESE